MRKRAKQTPAKPVTAAPPRELDSRKTTSIHVQLLWSQEEGRVWVSVFDRGTGETFRVAVKDSRRALDVFNHPYAYAAHDRIDAHASAATSW